MSMCTPEHSPICDFASILTFSVSKKKRAQKFITHQTRNWATDAPRRQYRGPPIKQRTFLQGEKPAQPAAVSAPSP